MAHTYSELVGIRDYCKETKHRLSNLYGMISSSNLIPTIDADIISDVVDDAGVFFDDIISVCNIELKQMDARKEKEAAGSISPRCSRWY